MRFITYVSLVFALLLGSATANAQSGVSTIAAVTPSNASQCPTSLYTNVLTNVETGNNPSSIVQQGTCIIPVTWHTPMPSSLYAISCVPEAGIASGYLMNTAIDGVSRTTTGFNLIVTFYINNLLAYNNGNIPPGAYSVNGTNDYIVGAPPNQPYVAPFQPSDLGTQYVDCGASNQ